MESRNLFPGKADVQPARFGNHHLKQSSQPYVNRHRSDKFPFRKCLQAEGEAKRRPLDSGPQPRLHWNQLRNFKSTDVSATPRNSDLIGWEYVAGIGRFKHSPGDCNMQPDSEGLKFAPEFALDTSSCSWCCWSPDHTLGTTDLDSCFWEEVINTLCL